MAIPRGAHKPKASCAGWKSGRCVALRLCTLQIRMRLTALTFDNRHKYPQIGAAHAAAYVAGSAEVTWTQVSGRHVSIKRDILHASPCKRAHLL